ncbi:hypothetical protein EU538_11320 [Candidatus Thorarchaeota archaeon]|nr:MAG: hypothetical protein EU538_11320 [Candidatus Thorarchaeota archaeon]
MKSRSMLLGYLLTVLLLFSVQTSIGDLPANPSPSRQIIERETDSQDCERTSDDRHVPAAAIDMNAVPYTVENTPEAFQGYNLFVLGRYSTETGNVDEQLLIMDMEGNIVADRYIGEINTFSCPAELITPSTALVGTSEGAAIWNITDDTMEYFGIYGHHEYEYNPNADTIFTLRWLEVEIEGETYLYDTIAEYNKSGDLIWSLDVSTFMPPEQWCPFHDYGGGHPDISHSNTIFYEAEDDIIYYNSRNTNTFYKISHSTKEVLWGVGEYGNFTMFDIYGNQRSNLFYHAHSVERVDENTFILFDNDLHNQTDITNHVSRMLEIEIDLDSMTANQTWMWQAPSTYYSAGWGDADRLPNGNRLGAFGYWSSGGQFSSSLVEVDGEGNIVWEMQFGYTSEYMYGVYRMERIRFQPHLVSPHDGQVFPPDNSSISWDCWFNYRNKEVFESNYTLLLDDVKYSEGNFSYDTFWRPTRLDFNISGLELGEHNATLLIGDGYGNTASDLIEFNMTAVSLVRVAPSVMEKGNPANRISWTGFTPSPLTCKVFCNGTQCLEFEWTGEEILLDPANLSVGNNHISLEFWNGTERVYDEDFWVELAPTLPPAIEPQQDAALGLFWNMSFVLEWNLHDTSPKSWSIAINDTTVASGTQSSRDYEVTWSVPTLDEGIYAVELKVTDELNLTSYDSVTLVINPPHSPVIEPAEFNTEIIWGTEDALLKWRAHGSETWWLFRNGTLFASGSSSGIDIENPIESWQQEGWRLGKYNLTLVCSDGSENRTSTTWVDVIYSRGDAYADTFAETRSSWYLMGSNALGPPDGGVATVFLDYGNGYLTLDMGEYGHILNGAGDDFTVIAGGGEYTVSVGNSLSDAFASLGSGTGNQSFDLLPSGLESVRYVMVEYHDDDAVLLDAIVAIHFDVVTDDTTPPIVEGPEDITGVFNETTYELHWSCSDATPWSYSILIDGVTIESGPWEGEDIPLSYLQDAAGTVNITLVLTDLFGNNATDEVRVTLENNTPPSDNLILTVVTGVAVIGVAAVSVVVYVRRR